MLYRKDFNTIGVMIASTIQTAQANTEQAEEIVKDWADYLKTTNPRFKYDDFVAYVKSLCRARGYNIFNLS
jgi:hypothetical protein